MEQVKIRATKDSIKKLVESILWQDIVNELESWKESFQLEQDSIVDDAATENPSTASVLLHMGDLNGRKKAVDYMIGIPDVFLGILETNEEVSHAGQGIETNPE